MRITKENIHEFIDETIMNCDNYCVTHIDYIPDHITHLYCHYNKLTSLPKLPESLEHLYCSWNRLTSLPKLPNGLISLYCWHNQLTEISILPEGLKKINFVDNNLPYDITIDNFKEHNQLIKRKEILSKICV